MPPDRSSTVQRCAACNAALLLRAERCWLCGARVNAGANGVISISSPALQHASHSGRPGSFSLASLMLFVTLASIIFGVISIAPGVGIALALGMAPVLAYTAILVRREEALGHALRPGDRIVLFFGSLGVVLLSGVAAAIAFGVTCFASFWAGAAAGGMWGTGELAGLGWGFATGIGFGSIAAAYVGYRAIVWLSRRRGVGLSRSNKLFLVGAVILVGIAAAIWFFLADP